MSANDLPAAASLPARLDEADARRVLLVQAVETTAPPASLWSPEDAAWASRLASETAGADAAPPRWIAERARHACERLLPRDAALAAAARPAGRTGLLLLVAAVGAFVLGLAADSLTGAGQIHLLAPPWLALLAWNLAVYAALIVWPLWRQARPGSGAAGRAIRGLRGWLQRRIDAAPRSWPVAPSRQPAAAALGAFATAWAARGAAPALSRAALLLHVAAAALALGLVTGLYLRGLVFDFRAGWQSTFLDAPTVHALLGTLLAPASALTGIELPTVDGIAALRIAPGAAAVGPAADWIHLLAVTLLLAVVLPRALLAVAAALRAAWQARRIELPLAEPYFMRLLASTRRAAPRVQVLPHGASPGAAAALGLRALLVATFGELDGAQALQLAAPTRYGDEDGPATRSPPPAGTTLRIALVDLAATPEAEAHGRWLARLRAASPVPLVLLADESAWQRRFAALPARGAERRAAWQALAATQGVGFASLALEDGDAAADHPARAALEAAIAAFGPVPDPAAHASPAR